MNKKQYPACFLSWAPRFGIIFLVVLVHLVLFWQWVKLPVLLRQPDHEMTLSMVSTVRPQVPVAIPTSKQKIVSQKKQVAERPQEILAAQAATAVAAEKITEPALPAPAEKVVAAQAVTEQTEYLDREADYRARYLDNPAPVYPKVAQRMGWQGRVVLNVEVSASGWPHQIKLQQSSGYEMLDNAALEAVRRWHFEPARQYGEPVKKWFLIPITFNLKVSP